MRYFMKYIHWKLIMSRNNVYKITCILMYMIAFSLIFSWLLSLWTTLWLLRMEFVDDQEEDKEDREAVEDKWQNIELVDRLADNETNPGFQTCTVPILDPYDASILNMIIHPGKLQCQKVQPNLFYLNSTGYILPNNTEFKLYNYSLEIGHNSSQPEDSKTRSVIRCSVRERKVNSDPYTEFYEEEQRRYYANSYENENISAQQEANEGSQEDYDLSQLFRPKLDEFPYLIAKGDYAVVQCSSDFSDYTPIYSELFLYPGASTKNITFGQETEQQLTVLLFFIDSISISSLKRHLPKTLKVMERMGFYIFSSFNKVADNSFPNLMPILTGKRAGQQQPDMPDEFNEDITQIRFDHWPFIWKDFANKSYVTVFSEDTPYMGLFHLGANGFENAPTNYYYHEYWKSVFSDGKVEGETRFCTGNKPNVEVQLDIVRKHYTKYRNKRQFLWIYLTEMSHSYDYEIEMADDMLTNFFAEFYQKGWFDKTALIFEADHGHRSSIIRTTNVGLIEERLPFFSIYLPKWFKRKHPNIHRNLKSNSELRRLTSHFDTHETLMDLLHSNFNGKQRPMGSRGLSHFYPIPANRSCHSAGVPLFYCTCQQLEWVPMVLGEELVQYIAKEMIQALNYEITVQEGGKCRNFTLKSVLKAEKLKIITKGKGEWRDFRLKIVASPKNATFEALMRKYPKTDKFGLGSDFSRLDRYGNQSHCIRSKRMKKLCICNDMT